LAIFHLKADIICRSHGRSSVAAAAYRAGQRIRDDRQGIIFDFTRRKHVAWTEILSPANGVDFMSDRAKLWNHIEAQEIRKDSQLAREVLVALPHELRLDQQIALVKKYVRQEFTSRGLVVDACIHNNPTNCHAHLLVAMRKVQGEGFGAKCRELNGRDYLKNLRERWARTVNLFLMTKGHKVRIDHRKKVDALNATSTSLNKKEKKMTTHNTKNQQKKKTTTRAPLIATSISSASTLFNASSNIIACVGDPLPKEIYDYLQIALAELIARIFEGDSEIRFDQGSGTYKGYHCDQQVIEVSKDKIACRFGTDKEVEFAIAAAITFGWKRIRLSGSEDFKQRAYAEALRRGYGASDIDGYVPLTITCTPSIALGNQAASTKKSTGGLPKIPIR
jgi:MobA/MobL family/Large polyvalent protein-associated domain 7